MMDKTYCLQGGGKTSQNSQGKGWTEDVSFTINTVDVYAVVVEMENDRAVIVENKEDSNGVCDAGTSSK